MSTNPNLKDKRMKKENKRKIKAWASKIDVALNEKFNEVFMRTPLETDEFRMIEAPLDMIAMGVMEDTDTVRIFAFVKGNEVLGIDACGFERDCFYGTESNKFFGE